MLHTGVKTKERTMDKILASILDDKDSTILFVGVGNRIKSDDAVGIYICNNISETERIKTLVVESGIEKYVGKINSMAPDILVLVDCTDFNEKPGYVSLVPMEKVQDTTVNTHTISLNRFGEFFPMKTYILGIQPYTVTYGEDLSPLVYKKARELIDQINR